MKYDKDYLHGKYLDILKNTSLEDFKNININTILFNDIWFSFELERIDILKVLIKRLFFDYLVVDYKSIESEKNLVLTYKYNRLDHDNYWKSFKDILGSYNELEIHYKKSNFKLSCSIYKDIKLILKYFLVLKYINNHKTRIWLSIQLLNAIKIVKKLDDLDVKCSSFFTFFDGGFEGNLISQYLKNKGSTTVTLQHGQSMFRSKEQDRMNQSVILNFVSDYCFCKGEFSKSQFIKAGYDEKRVMPLGNLDSLNIKECELKLNDNKKICVFLDSPGYSFYERATNLLLEIVNNFSENFNYYYYVKPHPADKKKIYENFISEKRCLGLLQNNYSLDDIKEFVDFSVFHASAIYADLLLRYMKAYKFDTEYSFPIVSNKDDVFSSIEELELRVKEWDEKSYNSKVKYFENENTYYSNPKNITDRYREFIKSLN